MATDVCQPGPPISGPGWKSSPKDMGNKIHSLCSYMAMFPPNIPNYFISLYSKPGDVVLDPFSGRGTTPFEACNLGRVGIGNDKNPLAYLLTKAKVNVPLKSSVLWRLDDLADGYPTWDGECDGIPSKIEMIFHPSTLRQLVYLREELEWRRSNVDCFIMAMLTGIAHGNSQGYLSLRMPNTFSMSPNYVKGYIEQHHLERPEREAFGLLRQKLERCHQRPKTRGKAYNYDARHLSRVRDDSVDLVMTSPPYTRVIRYGDYNWIRLWFLDRRSKEVERSLFCTQSLTKYTEFMNGVLKEMARVTKPGGRIVLVIGDVQDKETHEDENLAELVKEQCAIPLGLKVEDIVVDNLDVQVKVSRIWGQKKGKATKTDRALVLVK